MPKFIHKLGVGVSYNVRETLQWCDVADSEHSIILQQVENGVAVRMAVLFLLAAKG